MATPLGHALAGASASLLSGPDASLRGPLAVGALAGAAPDLDFLPGIVLGDPSRFHHGPSHSLAFAVAAAGLAWLLASRHRWRWALSAGSAYASHLLLDALTVDPSTPVGLQLFWPLDDAYVLSPFTPLPRVLHTTVSVVNLHNLAVALLELVLFGGLLWLVVRARSGATGKP